MISTMIITTVESDDNEMVITYNNNYYYYDNKCKANKIMLTIILMNKQQRDNGTRYIYNSDEKL